MNDSPRLRLQAEADSVGGRTGTRVTPKQDARRIGTLSALGGGGPVEPTRVKGVGD